MNNNIELVKALKRWATGLDGNDGALEGVLNSISYPEGFDYDGTIEQLDRVIGSRLSIDTDILLDPESNELRVLDDWAVKRADEIQYAVERLHNERYILRFLRQNGVDNGKPHYQTLREDSYKYRFPALEAVREELLSYNEPEDIICATLDSLTDRGVADWNGLRFTLTTRKGISSK